MKHRLFLALSLPPHVTASIAELQIRLDKLHLPIIWPPPEKLHLTLNFIGKVDMEKQIEIIRSVTDISMSHRSFSLRPIFLDTLYKKHDTSLVYLAVGGDVEALSELQSSLARELTDQKISQPDKFQPHIVIGKLKKMDPVMTKDVLQKIQDVDIDPLPEFVVDTVCLYESMLTREGSHYRRIGRYMLQ